MTWLARRWWWGLVAILAWTAAGCSREARWRRHVARADRAWEVADPERARIEYLNAHRLNPRDVRVVQRLAALFQRRGDDRAALEYWTLAKGLGGVEREVELGLAVANRALGRMEEARAAAMNVLEREPGNDEALMVASDAAVKPAGAASMLGWLEARESELAGRTLYHRAVANLRMRVRDHDGAGVALARALALEPGSAEVHYDFGNLCWERGDLPGAGAAYRRAAERAPAGSHLRWVYAGFLIRTGALAEARRELESGVGSGSATGKGASRGQVGALAMLAQVAWLEGRHGECRDLADRVLAVDAADPLATVVRAGAMAGLGEMGKALETLERLALRHERRSDVQFQVAVAYQRLEEWDRCQARLRRVLELAPGDLDASLMLAEVEIRRGTPEGALERLRALMRLHPGALRVRRLLVAACRVAGRGAEEWEVCRDFREAEPGNPEAWQMEGSALRRLGRLAEAEESLRRAASLGPGLVGPVSELVAMASERGDFEAVLAWADRLLAMRPGVPEALSWKAAVLGERGDRAGAEALYREVIRLAPHHGPAYEGLAGVLMGAGRLEEALGHIRMALQKRPRDVALWMEAGQLEVMRGGWEAAVASFEEVLKLEPRFFPALNNLAFLHGERTGKLDQALELALAARRAAPEDPRVADTVGWVLWKRGEYGRALGLIVEAASRLPGDLEVILHLGMAYSMSGREAEAAEALRRVRDGAREPRLRETAERALKVIELPGDEAAASRVLEERLAEFPRDVMAHFQMAKRLERQGRRDGALGHYRAALAVHPSAAPVLREQVRVLWTGGAADRNEAVEATRKASQAAVGDPEIACLAGWMACERGDFAGARVLLQEAVRGGRREGRFPLAKAEYHLGRVREAGVLLDACVGEGVAGGDGGVEIHRWRDWVKAELRGWEVEPVDAERIRVELENDPWFLPAKMARVAHEVQAGRLDEAEKACVELQGRFPSATLVTMRLASILILRGDDGRASTLVAKLQEALPDDAEVAGLAGRLAYRRGDMARASVLLNQASGVLGESAEVLYLRGLSSIQAGGDPVQARALLGKALAMRRDHPLAAEARRWLSP